jgi:phage tail sheath protein FI
MALFTPSESPAVVVKEVDLSGVVPNVQTTTGAAVGNFRWGPVGERKLISNETELVNTYSSPDSSNTIDFHSASMFLKYSNSMFVTREVTSAAMNAGAATKGTFDSDGATGTTTLAQLVKGKTDFDTKKAGFLSQSPNSLGGRIRALARFPGELGNSIAIHTLTAGDSATMSGFTTWAYRNNFNLQPGTSTYAAKFSSSHDEIHVAIVDEDGQISGTKNTVLEAYDALSVAPDAVSDDGTSNYVRDVINERSNYVYFLHHDSAEVAAGAGVTKASNGNVNYKVSGIPAETNQSFTNGENSGSLGTAEFQSGFDLYEDRDTVQVDFLIAPGMASRSDQTTITNDLVSTATGIRKDCVVVSSPSRADVVDLTSGQTEAIVAQAATFTASSYLIVDNNYLKVYDKYNDQYIFIPAASSTAGIMALSDFNAAPWFSPAGSRRGQLLGITDLSWSPTKAQRDTLYRNYVNPIANIPGQGTMLYGDKTHLRKNSAFDRINVRRLFLSIERAIAAAAQNVMFEFNDEFTRAEFVNIVEPFLREIKGRRGITDFKLVCDATNNTAAVIDRNEFIANVFVKPARSINFVTLNFVGVRTGVDFTEIVGTV